MPIKTVTCIEVRCDRCDDEWFYEQAAPHYSSLDDARDHLARPPENEFSDKPWLIEEGGRVQCPSCVAFYECERVGHVWDHDGVRSAMGGAVLETTCGRCDRPINNLAEIVDQLTAPGGAV